MLHYGLSQSHCGGAITETTREASVVRCDVGPKSVQHLLGAVHQQETTRDHGTGRVSNVVVVKRGEQFPVIEMTVEIPSGGLVMTLLVRRLGRQSERQPGSGLPSPSIPHRRDPMVAPRLDDDQDTSDHLYDAADCIRCAVTILGAVIGFSPEPSVEWARR